MSNCPPNDDDDPNKGKKKLKQTSFGAFSGFTRKVAVKKADGSVSRYVDEKLKHTHKGPTAADKRYKCKQCGAFFQNSQGLGCHKLTCQKAVLALQQSAAASGVVMAVAKNPPPGSSSQPRIDGSDQPTQALVSVLLNEDEGVTEEGKEDEERPVDDADGDWEDVEEEPSVGSKRKADGRKSNRGKATRQQWSNTAKADWIHQYEMYHEETGLGVSDFVNDKRLDARFVTLLSASKGKWRHPENKEKILQAAAADERKNLLRTGRVTLARPKWPRMEQALEKEIRERRRRSARVSVTFIRTRAKKLMQLLYPDDARTFAASQGWILRFRRRKRIKFRRRQNKKKVNIEDKRKDVSTSALQ